MTIRYPVNAALAVVSMAVALTFAFRGEIGGTLSFGACGLLNYLLARLP